MSLESDCQAAFLLLAPHRILELRLFRRNVGVARFGDRTVRFSIRGQCDLWGVFRGGRHIELELKAKRGRLSKEQREWADFCASWGVVHLVLTQVKGETVAETAERWCVEVAER